MGATHLNKVLTAINIAPLPWNTFKSHEKEVGLCTEDMALQTCKEACMEEKRLTIENIEIVKQLL